MFTEIGGRVIIEDRIFVLGNPGSGKTSIVNALQSKKKETFPELTQGIEIDKLEFEIENIKVTASVWDFGGQSIYAQLYPAFASSKNIHLLVLDGKDSDEDAEYWLEQIAAITNGAPCIVITNKADQTT